MKKVTEDTYRQKVGEFIDYVNANLHKPLILSETARMIGVSQRQLDRIMNECLRESPSSYIARQRMERAVMYMQTTEITLPNLAEMIGYDNPQSFSKAFKRHFGISPKAYSEKLRKRLEKTVSLKSGGKMSHSPEITEEDEINLAYIRVIGKYGDPELYEKAWKDLTRFMKNDGLLSRETRYIGISFDDPNVTKYEQCRFYACASVQKTRKPKGEIGFVRIPKGKYAVFTLKGNYSKLQDLYNEISVGFEYELRHGVSFEEYVSDPEKTPEEDIVTKVFMPIK